MKVLSVSELENIQGSWFKYFLLGAASFGCGFSIATGNPVGAVISCGAAGSALEDLVCDC